jgi:hypothetical protein
VNAFRWIPSHIGIHENTVVDREAKNALDGHVSNCSIPYTDIKPCIVKYIIRHRNAKICEKGYLRNNS